MNFIRMGNVNLSDLDLHPRYKYPDGTCASFDLLNVDVLKRAHFYDVIEKARLNVYVTYAVEVNCVMRNGHTVKMLGKCTSSEYQRMFTDSAKKFK